MVVLAVLSQRVLTTVKSAGLEYEPATSILVEVVSEDQQKSFEALQSFYSVA
jgi:hypothetical protein